jgi:two-component system chemotaxis response regulator CheB
VHNSRQDGFAIVAIGASNGGVDALRELFAHLRPDIPAAIFITLHVGQQRSHLPELICQAGFVCRHAQHLDRIGAGHVLVAPPDHHLLIRRGHVVLSRGPRENWARPAVDPMLRTAAEAYGPRVVGVILTGYLNDGTAGLFEVKRRGGITVVQDPNDATCPSMPASALSRVPVDYCVAIAAMPAVLYRASKKIAAGGDAPLLVDSGGLPHA